MYCLHCGNQIGDQVTFCPYCGQRVAAEPMPDASAQAAQGQDAQGAPNADPAATAAYPGATAQYPAQAAYQQQAGQGAADASQQQAGQGPADPSQQQPATDAAPQGQGEKKGPSAVTVVLAVVAVVAVLALVLVVTGVVDLGGSATTEDQTAEATADADDDADATDTDEAADADATDDAADTDDAATDDTSDATSDDATDTSDATSGRSSTSSGSAETTADSLLALLEEEGFDVYVSDECDYVDATMYGDGLSDFWFFDLTVEEDGTISDVDIYVYWPADGDVEEGFAYADELVAYVFDLLADGGYLDDWEDVPDATFPDEFVAEAVEFAAAATEEDSFSEVTETDEGYELWLYYHYDPDDYACMSYEAWR